VKEILPSIVQLIVGIAWPAATVWVVYILRREVKALLLRLSIFKYGDLEAKFESSLAEAEAKFLTIGATKLQPTALKIEDSTRYEQLCRIADVSPRAAILEAWILIETAAAKSGAVQGINIARINVPMHIDQLIRSNLLPKDSVELVKKLRTIRNQAAHLPDFTVSKADALRFLELATNVSDLILAPQLGELLQKKTQ
jgi:hypothetical protein